MEEFFSKISKDNFFLNLFVLGRPWNGFLIGLFSLIGFFQFGAFSEFSIWVILFLTFFFQYFAGTILNDICDFSADKINMPHRPLESGIVTLRQAKILMGFSYFLSFILSLFVSIHLFLWVFVFFIISVIYSVKPFRLVSRGFLGNLSLASVTIFIPVLAGMFIATKSFSLINLSNYLGLVFFTLFFSFFSIVKDFKDVKGDSVSGKKTFVVLHGFKGSLKFMVFGSVFFFILSTFYFSKFILSKFFLFLSVLFLIFLLYLQIKLFSAKKEHAFFERAFSNGRLLIFFYSLVLLFFIIKL